MVGKDMPARTVFVAAGREHSALYTRSALLAGASWVAGEPPAQLMQVLVECGSHLFYLS